jgi:hypothetical protein
MRGTQDGPREAEFTVRREPDRLEISMPVDGQPLNAAARVMLFIVFGSLELAGLSALWQRHTGQLVTEFPIEPALLVCTVFGVMVLNYTTAIAQGRERLILRRDVLIIKRGTDSIGSTDEYELARIKNLRYQPRQPNFLDGKGGPGPWAGPVAFDYGSRIIRFAKGVSEGAARQIIEELKTRHASLADRGQELDGFDDAVGS